MSRTDGGRLQPRDMSVRREEGANVKAIVVQIKGKKRQLHLHPLHY